MKRPLLQSCAQALDAVPLLKPTLVELDSTAKQGDQNRSDHRTFLIDDDALTAADLIKTVLLQLLRLGYIEFRVRTVIDALGPGILKQVILKESRFVLNEAAMRLAAEQSPRKDPGPSAKFSSNDAAPETIAMPIPMWRTSPRPQLWWNGWLIKQFKRRAPSQRTILDTFEEDGWPPRIDDPLDRPVDSDPYERLHEAVKGLNRNRVHPFLVFERDGTGQGVLWSVSEEGRRTLFK